MGQHERKTLGVSYTNSNHRKGKIEGALHSLMTKVMLCYIKLDEVNFFFFIHLTGKGRKSLNHRENVSLNEKKSKLI